MPFPRRQTVCVDGAAGCLVHGDGANEAQKPNSLSIMGMDHTHDSLLWWNKGNEVPRNRFEDYEPPLPKTWDFWRSAVNEYLLSLRRLGTDGPGRTTSPTGNCFGPTQQNHRTP